MCFLLNPMRSVIWGVLFAGQVSSVSPRSMEVMVEVRARSILTGEERLTNRCSLRYVGIRAPSHELLEGTSRVHRFNDAVRARLNCVSNSWKCGSIFLFCGLYV